MAMLNTHFRIKFNSVRYLLNKILVPTRLCSDLSNSMPSEGIH